MANVAQDLGLHVSCKVDDSRPNGIPDIFLRGLNKGI